MARKERTKLWILSGAPKLPDAEDAFEFETIDEYNQWLIANSENVYTTTTSMYVRDNIQLRVSGTWENLSRSNYVIIENLYENTTNPNRFKWGYIGGATYVNRKVSFLDWHIDVTPYLGVSELRKHIIIYNGVINRMHRNQWVDTEKTFANNQELGLFESVQAEGEHRFFHHFDLTQTMINGDEKVQQDDVTFLVLTTTSNLNPATGPTRADNTNVQEGGVIGLPSQYNTYLIPFSMTTYRTLSMAFTVNGQQILVPGNVKFHDLISKLSSDPELIDGTNRAVTFYYTNAIGQAWYLNGSTVVFGNWDTIPDFGKDAVQIYTIKDSTYQIVTINYIKGEKETFVTAKETSLLNLVRNLVLNKYALTFDNILTYYKSIHFALADGKNKQSEYLMENFNRDYPITGIGGGVEGIELSLWRKGSMGLQNRIVTGFNHYYKHIGDGKYPYDDAPDAYSFNFAFSNSSDQGLALLSNTYNQSVYLTQNTYAQSFKNAQLSLDNQKISQAAQQQNLTVGQNAANTNLGVSLATNNENMISSQNREANNLTQSQQRQWAQNYGENSGIYGAVNAPNINAAGAFSRGYQNAGLTGGGLNAGMSALGTQFAQFQDANNNDLAQSQLSSSQVTAWNNQQRNNATTQANQATSQGAERSQMMNTQGADRDIANNNYKNAIANIQAGRDDLFLQPATTAYQGGNSYFEAMHGIFNTKIILTAPEKEAMKKLDYYFNKYGYLSNIVINSSQDLWNRFSTRQRFNYVQMKYVKINSKTIPHQYIKTLQAMLVTGVIIWHKQAIDEGSYYNYAAYNEQNNLTDMDPLPVPDFTKPLIKTVQAESFKNATGLHFKSLDDKANGVVTLWLDESKGEKYIEEVKKA